MFFAITSATASWDWIMSIDTHWFSTLFGWYTFASFFVSSCAVIAIGTLPLILPDAVISPTNVNPFPALPVTILSVMIFKLALILLPVMSVIFKPSPNIIPLALILPKAFIPKEDVIT